MVYKIIYLFLVSIISTWSATTTADALKQSIRTEMQTTQAAISSQKKIDALSDQTRKMLQEYRMATRQIETLKTYNQHLQELLQSQQLEKTSLQQQLQHIEITQREILPLTLQMLDKLALFIQLDLPFLPEERQHRIRTLKEMMIRADVSEAEKFRRLLEAYQIENEYGNTIEAYRAELQLGDNNNVVDFLRIGRLALYYQRLDGSETGVWNQKKQRWQTLPSAYANTIRNALRMARKETQPDLLRLPVAVAEAAQ